MVYYSLSRQQFLRNSKQSLLWDQELHHHHYQSMTLLCSINFNPFHNPKIYFAKNHANIVLIRFSVSKLFKLLLSFHLFFSNFETCPPWSNHTNILDVNYSRLREIRSCPYQWLRPASSGECRSVTRWTGECMCSKRVPCYLSYLTTLTGPFTAVQI